MEVGTYSRIKRRIRHLTPGFLVKSTLTRRMVRKVASKYNLVYFGFVDKDDDDHKMVRGHTVSRSIIDNHYCLGSIKGYDVAFVQRNDLARMLNGTEQRCHWLIASINLKTTTALPHLYVGPKGDNELFKASYTGLHHILLGHTAIYTEKFLSNFSVFSRPSDALIIEQILPPATTSVLVSYFAGMPFEVEDNVLHIYNENSYPTARAIDAMFENGIWLAEQIDNSASQARV